MARRSNKVAFAVVLLLKYCIFAFHLLFARGLIAANVWHYRGSWSATAWQNLIIILKIFQIIKL